MNGSIGNSLLFYIVTIMVGALLLVFSASFAYSKAYKAKNMIIDVINDHKGEGTHVTNGGGEYFTEEDEIIKQIDAQLSKIGYRKSNVKCRQRHAGRLVYPEPASQSHSADIRNSKGYCIYKIYQTNSMGSRSFFYEVETYMYFDIPLFNFIIPVYGQTKSYQPNPENIILDEDEDLDDTDEINGTDETSDDDTSGDYEYYDDTFEDVTDEDE